MVVGPSGKRVSIRVCQKCRKCGISTEHVCYGIRYEKRDRASESYLKHMFWACGRCGESSEEVKEVPEPTERLMLIKRLLKVGEDYDVKSVSIQSDANLLFVFYRPSTNLQLAEKRLEHLVRQRRVEHLGDITIMTEKDAIEKIRLL